MKAIGLEPEGIGEPETAGHIQRHLPARFSWLFLKALQKEVGEPMLKALMRQAGMVTLDELDVRGEGGSGISSAEYARLLGEVRSYYGQGARGLLIRVGQMTWDGMVQSSGVMMESKGLVGRVLLHKKATQAVLELLAEELCGNSGHVSVHRMDTEYYLVDCLGDATCGQTAEAPICAVTVGLIQGALNWGTGEAFDVDEIACMASGSDKCKFRIRA